MYHLARSLKKTAVKFIQRLSNATTRGSWMVPHTEFLVQIRPPIFSDCILSLSTLPFCYRSKSLHQADEYILPSTRRSLIVADSPSKNLGFVRIPVETPIAVINEEGDVVGTVNGTAMRF